MSDRIPKPTSKDTSVEISREIWDRLGTANKRVHKNGTKLVKMNGIWTKVFWKR